MKKETIKLTVWITLFVALAITTFFVTNEDNNKNKTNAENKELFKIKKEDIQKIQISTESNKITAKKENKIWTITKPKIYETEKRHILNWIDKFSSITPDESFETKSTLDFGIATKQQPDFYAWDKENKKYTITVGDKTPNQEKYYIKTNQNEKIFTVNPDTIEDNGLDISLKKLRNKDFLKIKTNDISSVTFDKFLFTKTNTSIAKLKKLPENIKLTKNVNYQENTQILKLKGKMTKEQKTELEELSEDKEYKNAINQLFNKSKTKQWTISNIKDKEIDINKTNSFVNALLNIKANDFTDDTIPFNNKESLVFTIKNNSNKEITLYLSAYKDKVYAQIEKKENIYEIQKHLFDRLNKNESDFVIEEIKKEEVKAKKPK